MRALFSIFVHTKEHLGFVRDISKKAAYIISLGTKYIKLQYYVTRWTGVLEEDIHNYNLVFSELPDMNQSTQESDTHFVMYDF